MQLTRLSLSATPGLFVNVGSKLVRVSGRYSLKGSEESAQELVGVSTTKVKLEGVTTDKLELVGE